MTDRRFRQLTESQIQKAIAEGKLKHLEGEGRPLPDHPEAAYIDPADAIGHRIMAEAGALPEEIIIKRALVEAKEAWRRARGTVDEKPAMARVAELTTRLSIAEEARRKFLKS